jgi:hypothetical protein
VSKTTVHLIRAMPGLNIDIEPQTYKEKGKVVVIIDKIKREYITKNHITSMMGEDAKTLWATTFNNLHLYCILREHVALEKSNVIKFPPETRDEISKRLDVGDRQIKRYLDDLCEENILLKLKTNTYFINPKHWCYGGEIERAKLLSIWDQLKDLQYKGEI